MQSCQRSFETGTCHESLVSGQKGFAFIEIFLTYKKIPD